MGCGWRAWGGEDPGEGGGGRAPTGQRIRRSNHTNGRAAKGVGLQEWGDGKAKGCGSGVGGMKGVCMAGVLQ